MDARDRNLKVRLSKTAVRGDTGEKRGKESPFFVSENLMDAELRK